MPTPPISGTWRRWSPPPRPSLSAAGVSDTVEVVVADAGYWHQKQMESVVNKGIQVLIPPDAGKRRGTRPGWDGGIYAHMRRVLETELGGGLYRKRKAMIEPVFANTKFNRRIDRFERRGRSAVRSEWRLITATHNLLKLHKHQIALLWGPEKAPRAAGNSPRPPAIINTPPRLPPHAGFERQPRRVAALPTSARHARSPRQMTARERTVATTSWHVNGPRRFPCDPLAVYSMDDD